MPLAEKIKLILKKQHQIRFAEYMELCLFDADYGYYNCLQKIGKEGDFITSPELGPHFAYTLGRFIVERNTAFAHPVIVELGGGTGQMAFDLLIYLAQHQSLPERYLIVEKSLSLMHLQQEKLKALDQVIFSRIEWHQALNERNLQGILLANEFFDALPVERFMKKSDGIGILGVEEQGAGLCEVRLNESVPIPLHLQDIFAQLPVGYRSEICLVLPGVLESFLSAFSEALAVIIDYGEEAEKYYHPLKENGTLNAYKGHQMVNVLDAPGEADLTADVDFTYLAQCFINNGWEIEFLKPQNQFLLELGFLAKEGIKVDNYHLKRLIDRRLMGERFKVLVARLTASKNHQQHKETIS